MTRAPAPRNPDAYNVSVVLTAEELAMINAKRDEDNKIKPTRVCGAVMSHQTGRKCQATPGQGTDHPGWGYCKSHGGTTSTGKRHAAALMGADVIESQKKRFGGSRLDPSIANITAEQALLEEVRRSVAMVRWLEEMIAQWDYDDPAQKDAVEEYVSGQDLKGLPRLITETGKGISAATDKAEWLKVYREERNQSAIVAKMCIDAGIAHRMVSIAEDQGRVLATAMRTVLNLLALSPAQVQAVPAVVPAVLRAVAGGLPLEGLPAQLLELEPVKVLHEGGA